MNSAEICVIYNPTAGRGRAARRLAELRRTLGSRAEFRPTQAAGQGETLALQAAQSGFQAVAAAGGDGTVHEVANGILRAERPDVALAVFPIGSANDYAHSLDHTFPPGTAPDTMHVDVGVARAPDGRERYFVNGLGLGFNGAVTLESRKIRWLRGVPLYSLALLRALWSHYVHVPMRITLDETERIVSTLALTANLGRREGGFLMTPDARLDDGLFDYLHAGPLSRLGLLRCFPGMVMGRLPTQHPAYWTGRCQSIRVEAEAPLTVHLDGEFFSRPEDNLRQIEVRLLPRRLRVLPEAEIQRQ